MTDFGDIEFKTDRKSVIALAGIDNLLERYNLALHNMYNAAKNCNISGLLLYHGIADESFAPKLTFAPILFFCTYIQNMPKK